MLLLCGGKQGELSQLSCLFFPYSDDEGASTSSARSLGVSQRKEI